MTAPVTSGGSEFQIADLLDVSVDWLTGRSNVMDVMEMPES
jgi:hypothetical protein